MNEKTGQELMHEALPVTRLDAAVRGIMRDVDNYAQATRLTDRFGNEHGDRNAMEHFYKKIEAAIRELVR